MDRIDLTVPVDGIGTFKFRRRNMQDQFRIGAAYARLIEAVNPVPEDLYVIASAVATLNVLTVESPPGWNIEAMDPLDDASYARILKVFTELRAAEIAARAGVAAAAGEAPVAADA